MIAKMETSKTKKYENESVSEVEHKIEVFRTKMFQKDKKQLLQYADSILKTALKSKNKELIGEAYLTKGIVYYNKKQLQKALDNYIIADSYLVKTNNEYASYKVKYSIAHTKYYLGFYHEAIALFKECLAYFEEENDRAYLNTIHSLGLCYNKINKYDSCSKYNSLGLKEGVALKNNEMKGYFNHSEGVNQYFKNNFKGCIAKLCKVMPFLKNKNDFANETVAYFYIGKAITRQIKKQSHSLFP